MRLPAVREYEDSTFVKRQADVLRRTYGQGARIVAKRHHHEATRLRKKDQAVFWSDVLLEIEIGKMTVMGTPQEGVLP